MARGCPFEFPKEPPIFYKSQRTSLLPSNKFPWDACSFPEHQLVLFHGNIKTDHHTYYTLLAWDCRRITKICKSFYDHSI